MNRFRLVVCSLVCAIVGLLAFPAAAAEVRPYAGGGAAQFISATQYVGEGNATHLGRYTEAGTVAFTPTADPAVLHVEGAAIYTAANGDELWAVISGELNGQTGVITATLTYVGGTGRFATATGSSDLSGQMLGGGAVAASVAGTISY